MHFFYDWATFISLFLFESQVFEWDFMQLYLIEGIIYFLVIQFPGNVGVKGHFKKKTNQWRKWQGWKNQKSWTEQILNLCFTWGASREMNVCVLLFSLPRNMIFLGVVCNVLVSSQCPSSWTGLIVVSPPPPSLPLLLCWWVKCTRCYFATLPCLHLTPAFSSSSLWPKPVVLI